MKFRNDFVTNSSSSSFILVSKANIELSITDYFGREVLSKVDDCNALIDNLLEDSWVDPSWFDDQINEFLEAFNINESIKPQLMLFAKLTALSDYDRQILLTIQKHLHNHDNVFFADNVDNNSEEFSKLRSMEHDESVINFSEIEL